MELDEQKPAGLKGPQTYKLIEPVSWGSETIKEITIQPLKGKHLKYLKKESGVADLMVIASKASGTPQAVFDEMSAADVTNILELVGNSL